MSAPPSAEPTSHYLDDDQLRRVAALTEARGVVLGQERVPEGYKAIEGHIAPSDLVIVADYIINGKMPGGES